MIAGISITCFAASYTVALVLEATRLFFRSGIRGAAMLAFSGAGWLAHSLFLISEAIDRSPTTPPLSSWFHWYLLAAWLLAAGYICLSVYQPRTPSGLFMLPLVLVLIIVAWLFRNDPPFPAADAYAVWGRIHGVALLTGSVVVMGGFVAGLMYVVQSARLKRKLPPRRGLRLPSLEWLERVNGQSLAVSALLLGVGVLSGVILNLLKHMRDIERFAWNDPVVWTSTALFVWLVVALLFSALYKPARQGRKVAYLTLASFLFLMIALAATLLFSEHAMAAHGNAAILSYVTGSLVEGNDEGTDGRL